MSFKDKKIAVLFGGTSGEREISLLSGNAVLQALIGAGLNAHAFDPATRDLSDLKREGFDVCMINLHGRNGEDGTVQGTLELLGIPYTGSGVQASAIAIDKRMTKRIWESYGLPTPPWRVTNNAAETCAAFEAFASGGHKMIVKPALEGSSLGLTRVSHIEQCAAAFEAASKLDGQALCEALVEGQEVTCVVLELEGKTQALPMIRIEAPDDDYDYQNKYFTGKTKYHIPCGLPEGEEAHIQSLVTRAFHAINCRGWARADVMIDAKTRQPYLLEINTSPGMTGRSHVPMAAKYVGIEFADLCQRILQTARLDHAGARA